MVRRCMKITTGQEYAAKIINTKKLSARGGYISTQHFQCLPPLPSPWVFLLKIALCEPLPLLS